MLLDLKFNQTLKHSSTQTKTYNVLRITECQSIEIFAEKQQVKWLAHCVRMENDALQKFSLYDYNKEKLQISMVKNRVKIGNGPATVLEISPR